MSAERYTRTIKDSPQTGKVSMEQAAEAARRVGERNAADEARIAAARRTLANAPTEHLTGFGDVVRVTLTVDVRDALLAALTAAPVAREPSRVLVNGVWEPLCYCAEPDVTEARGAGRKGCARCGGLLAAPVAREPVGWTDPESLGELRAGRWGHLYPSLSDCRSGFIPLYRSAPQQEPDEWAGLDPTVGYCNWQEGRDRYCLRPAGHEEGHRFGPRPLGWPSRPKHAYKGSQNEEGVEWLPEPAQEGEGEPRCDDGWHYILYGPDYGNACRKCGESWKAAPKRAARTPQPSPADEAEARSWAMTPTREPRCAAGDCRNVAEHDDGLCSAHHELRASTDAALAAQPECHTERETPRIVEGRAADDTPAQPEPGEGHAESQRMSLEATRKIRQRKPEPGEIERRLREQASALADGVAPEDVALLTAAADAITRLWEEVEHLEFCKQERDERLEEYEAIIARLTRERDEARADARRLEDARLDKHRAWMDAESRYAEAFDDYEKAEAEAARLRGKLEEIAAEYERDAGDSGADVMYSIAREALAPEQEGERDA